MNTLIRHIEFRTENRNKWHVKWNKCHKMHSARVWRKSGKKIDEQLKGVTSMVEQRTRNLREEFSSELGATRRDFETQLAAV
jgi:adenine-specific DNA methylase